MYKIKFKTYQQFINIMYKIRDNNLKVINIERRYIAYDKEMSITLITELQKLGARIITDEQYDLENNEE